MSIPARQICNAYILLHYFETIKECKDTASNSYSERQCSLYISSTSVEGVIMIGSDYVLQLNMSSAIWILQWRFKKYDFSTFSLKFNKIKEKSKKLFTSRNCINKTVIHSKVSVTISEKFEKIYKNLIHASIVIVKRREHSSLGCQDNF